jgi:hypothetical protein
MLKRQHDKVVFCHDDFQRLSPTNPVVAVAETPKKIFTTLSFLSLKFLCGAAS